MKTSISPTKKLSAYNPVIHLACSILFIAVLAAPVRGQTVVGTITRPGLQPNTVAVYEAGNKVFVSDPPTGNLYIYNGATLAELGSVFIGAGAARKMLVHEASGKLYAFVGAPLNKIAVVNAVTGAFIQYLSGAYTNANGSGLWMEKDESLGQVYALSFEGLRQIDVTNNAETTIPGAGGGGFESLAFNPVTHEAFVVRFISNQLLIANGITHQTTPVANMGGAAVGVNWTENKAYISTGGGVGVPFKVYDRDTGVIGSVSANNDALVFAYNPTSNRMYTDSEVNAISSIIEGSSDAFFNLPMFSATTGIAVRNATNHVYYVGKNFVGVLDDSTQLLELIPVNNPFSSSTPDIAINQTTGRVFAINYSNLGFVTAIQDTETMIRPPVYLGSTGFPAVILTLDPVSRSVADTLSTPGFHLESEHAMAVRPGGGRLYAPFNFTFENKLGVIAGNGSQALLTSFSTGGTAPRTVAVTPDGSRIYVTNSGSNNVSVINAANNTVITTITVGASSSSAPWGSAMAPDGSKVYVTLRGENSVKVINTTTNTVAGTIPVGSSPWGIAVNPAGTKAFVANSGAGTVSVIDLSTNTVITTVTVGNTPHWLALTPDGKNVYVGNRGGNTVTVINAGTNAMVQTINVGVNPEGITALPNGSEVWVVNSNPTGASSLSVINPSNFSVTTVPLPPAPPPGTNLIGYSLTTADPTSKFAGRVLGGGVPLNGALVRALQSGVEKGSATTNTAGDYSIFSLKAGTYDLEVSAAGYSSQSLPGQTVGAGRTTIVNFSLISTCPTITVNPTNPALSAGTAGQPYSQTFTATGGTAPYGFTMSAGTLPPGLSLSSGGVLSGTPTGFGTFTFTVKAADTNGCMGDRQYTLPICPIITVNPATLPNGTVGMPYNQTLTATGGAAPYSFAVTAGALPPGLSLSSAGQLSGTPSTGGTFNFTVTVTDASGCTGTRNYGLTIDSGGGTSGLQYYPLPSPIRLLDTRPGESACFAPGVPLGNDATRLQQATGTCSGVPAGALAIVGNATVVNFISTGFHWITLYPSDAPQPNASNLNFTNNQIVPNNFTVGLGPDGAFKIYSHASTHFIVDVTGYYAPPDAGGLYYHPLPAPVRLFDSRPSESACDAPGAPLSTDGTRTMMAHGTCFGATIPSTAKAIVGNATVVNFISTGFHWITLYPSGAPQPNASNLNFIENQIVPNWFVVKLSNDGKFNIYSHAATHFIVDVAGYFSEEPADANGPGLLYTALSKPVRLLDTRSGEQACNAPGVPLGNDATRTQTAHGTCFGETIPNTAKAVVGNATVVNFISTGFHWITLYPFGASQPNASNLNFTANHIVPNAFWVGLSNDGKFNIYSHASTHFIVDLTGYFAP